VVDWSWDLLSEPERAVARRLAAFAGGATAAAAERVCAGPPVAGDVFELVASLVDKSIVVAVPQPDGAATRYRMLETIREYAGERLDEAGERAVAEATHLAAMLDLVEAAEPHLRGADQLPWLARLRAEAEEIDVALQRAVAAEDAASGHRLVAGMGWSWIIRGLFEDLARWLDAVLPLDGPAPASARAVNWAYEALQCAVRRDGSGERDAVTAVVALAGELPRPLPPTLQLTWPIHTLFVDADDGPIRRLAAEAENPWVRGFAINTLALVAENNGALEEQRQLLRAAHEAFRGTGDRFGLGMVVHSLGELEDIAGEYEAAASAYDESIALAAELGNTDDLPLFESNRAMLEARRGDLGSARARLSQALDLPAAGNDGALLISLAHVEQMAGDLDRARHHLTAAAAADGIGSPHRRTSLGLTSAAVELAAGDLAAARACLAEAVATSAETRDGPVIARVAEMAATLALAEGDPAAAGLLLGVAAAQRGAVDVGNPEVLAAYDRARALGPAADEAMRRGRELPRDEGCAALAAYVGEQAAQVRRW
jgi:tetratricopeptide (TPR) repeat protein